MNSKERPYVLYVAEIIYSKISEIKIKNPGFSNIDAIDNFIGTKFYIEISSGEIKSMMARLIKTINKSARTDSENQIFLENKSATT